MKGKIRKRRHFEHNPYSFRDFEFGEYIYLIDSSIIMGNNSLKDSFKIDSKIRVYQERYEYVSSLRENLSRFGAYFTEGVLDEMKSYGEYGKYKKNLKKWSGKRNTKNLLKLRRIKEKFHKEKSRLLRDIFEKDFKLRLSFPQQFLNEFYLDDYSWFREEYGISNVDLELILSGGVISKLGEKTALISNDLALVEVWEFFCKQEGLGRDEFILFKRTGRDRFNRALLRY